MARPRKDSNQPSAQMRMQEAFWTLLAKKPYSAITVHDIITEANVNRNTFYYHYSYLDDLADVCIRDMLPRDMVALVITEAALHRTSISPQIIERYLPEYEYRLFRLQLVTGSHGADTLQQKFKEHALFMWLDLLGLTIDDLTADERIMVYFAVGGVTELLGNTYEPLSIESIQHYLQSDLAHYVFEFVTDTLRAVVIRKQQAQQNSKQPL